MKARTVIARATGRVNLMGEHTDYNCGYVLPTPIRLYVTVTLTPRMDRRVTVWSHSNTAGQREWRAAYDLGAEFPQGAWIDYVQGATEALANSGYSLRGFDARIQSEIPLGSGLSSSAALLVALMRAMRESFALPMDDEMIARCSHRAEVDFVGAHIGSMDHMVCSVGKLEHALLLDCSTLEFRHIPLPRESMDLAIIHSGVAHDLTRGDYNERRLECEEAVRLLSLASLREIQLPDLPEISRKIPAKLFQRVRHVVTENQRVLAAVKAIESGDIRGLGELFFESQRSLRDDFQISIPEIDMLIDLAANDPRVFGARMTGGGFGGSIVALTARGEAEQVARDVLAAYQSRSGRMGLALSA